MKIHIYVSNKYNPLIQEQIKSINKKVFEDINSVIDTGLSFSLKEDYQNQVDKFVHMTIDDSIKEKSLSEFLQLLNFFEDQLVEKFNLPKEEILIKFEQ